MTLCRKIITPAELNKLGFNSISLYDGHGKEYHQFHKDIGQGRLFVRPVDFPRTWEICYAWDGVSFCLRPFKEIRQIEVLCRLLEVRGFNDLKLLIIESKEKEAKNLLLGIFYNIGLYQ